MMTMTEGRKRGGETEKKVTKNLGWGHLSPTPWRLGGRVGFQGDSWFLVAWHVGYK